MRAVDPRVENVDRSQLLPEGVYRAGSKVEPAWLAGRLVLVSHFVTADQVWLCFVSVKRKGQIVDEMLRKWSGSVVPNLPPRANSGPLDESPMGAAERLPTTQTEDP